MDAEARLRAIKITSSSETRATTKSNASTKALALAPDAPPHHILMITMSHERHVHLFLMPPF